MAGVTDLPMRELAVERCGMAVGEMRADLSLAQSRKQLNDSDTVLKQAPLGRLWLVTRQLAEAARFNADLGADIIDINMGCPAKKSAAVQRGPRCWPMRRWWVVSKRC